PVKRQSRLVELACEAAVELDVVLGLDVGLGLRPDRRAVGDPLRLLARLADKIDRNGDRAGMLADDSLDPPRIEELLRLGVEMQDDPRAARRRLVERERGDCERTL